MSGKEPSKQQKTTSPRLRRRSNAPSDPSPEASRRAVAILEVLAGQRTASEAAEALSISVNHYYLLERRALQGLALACEPQPKGPRGPGLEAQVEKLQRELERCRQECLRQAALVRAAQRAVGLSAIRDTSSAKKGPSATRDKAGRRKRKRSPAVRALRAAEAARKNSSRQDSQIGLENTAPGAPAALGKSAAVPASCPRVKEPHDGSSR